MKCLVIVIFWLGLVSIINTSAADIRFIPGKSKLSEGNQSWRDLGCIEVSGEITAADVDKLPALLRTSRSPKTKLDKPIVVLNSPGGDVVAAMQMGHLIRKANAWTIVEENKECSSACVYILAGGVERRVGKGARIGLHRPIYPKKYFANLTSDDARKAYSTLINVSRSYFEEMGVYPKLFDDMLKVPSEKIQYFSKAYAEAVNLEGTDPSHEEWETATREKQLGPEKTKIWNDLTKCLNSGVTHEVCMEKYGMKLFE